MYYRLRGFSGLQIGTLTAFFPLEGVIFTANSVFGGALGLLFTTLTNGW